MNDGITKAEPKDAQQTVGSVVPDDPSSQQPVVKKLDAPEPPPGFQLLEEVGRGGMGVIYRALDLAFDRIVALKFLQASTENNSPNALRFMDEARITGQLQHPGIPAVHQVGTLPNGRPYLVMKLIKGYTLSDLIWKKETDGKPAASPTRHVIQDNYLGIFEAICQAVGYAHAHHVIHRDLKPHNIMVGAFGEVQVMDWGLAKVLRPNEPPRDLERQQNDPQVTMTLASQSMVNTPGSQLTVAGSVLGTPAYMAPEQAIGANSQLDARADVFGLGAILCALLTGRPPFLGDNPESTRLLAALGMLNDSFEKLDECGAEPDLIALTKRCLSPQKNDRPADGGEVAREVARLRAAADERARQAELERSNAEIHAQEQRRRRRIVLITSAALMAVLTIGIISTTWGLFRAATKEEEATQAAKQEHDAKLAETEQRHKAEAKEAETQAVLDFVLNKVFAAARPEGLELGLGRNVKLRDALEAALKSVADDFSKQPLVEARIRMTLGQTFWHLGDLIIADAQLRRSLELFEKHLGSREHQTLLAMLSMANLHDQLEQYQPALQLRERAYEVAQERFGFDAHVTQMAMNNLTISYEKLGRQADVLKLREEVVKLTQAKLGTSNAFTMLCMGNLAMAYFGANRQAEALKLLDDTIALQKKHLGPTHPNTLDTMGSKAYSLDMLGRHQESLPLNLQVLQLRQEKLGPDHPSTLNAMVQLAYCHSCLGHNDDALKVVHAALPLFEKRYGNDHVETLNCLWVIIARLFDLERSQEAVPLIDLCLHRAKSPQTNPRLLQAMYVLRFRHYKLQKDVAGCVATIALWEKRQLKQVDNTVDLAGAWASIARLKHETDKTQGTDEADKAMERLQQAAAAGWKDAKYLETDDDYAPLRSRDDYRLLLAKLKKAAPAK